MTIYAQALCPIFSEHDTIDLIIQLIIIKIMDYVTEKIFIKRLWLQFLISCPWINQCIHNLFSQEVCRYSKRYCSKKWRYLQLKSSISHWNHTSQYHLGFRISNKNKNTENYWHKNKQVSRGHMKIFFFFFFFIQYNTYNVYMYIILINKTGPYYMFTWRCSKKKS